MVDEGMAGFFLERRFSKTVWRGDDLMDFIVEREFLKEVWIAFLWCLKRERERKILECGMHFAFKYNCQECGVIWLF